MHDHNVIIIVYDDLQAGNITIIGSQVLKIVQGYLCDMHVALYSCIIV